jgi:thiol-disulfide isomerase/thioredoxin/uncharacterized membrane protein YphA (DoxX/SURF4 family)
VNALLVSARCVVAAVFVVAGVGKLLDLGGSREALQEFGVAERWARLAGPALPVAELAVAGALLIRPTARIGAALAVALLGIFIAGVARALSQGRAPDCHCFGQIHSEPAGRATIIRNAVIAAPAVLILIAGTGPSIAHALGSLDGTQVALVATAVTAAVLALAAAQLFGNTRRLQAALDQATTTAKASGLPRGAAAPGFTLAPVQGAAASLDELHVEGRRTVLVFVSTGCGPCLRMLPLLAGWQDALANTITLPVIFSGERADIERIATNEGLSIALAQHASEVFSLYALRATPSAVLIDGDGRIASAPVEGAPAIEALIRTAVSADAAVERQATPA